MPKLFFSLFCTNFELNNKNPLGFKFSDAVFPCFWLLKDLIYANLCKLDAKRVLRIYLCSDSKHIDQT